MTSIFQHVVDQYPQSLREKKYQYWRMLRRANEDFRARHVPREINGYSDFLAEKQAFEQWMLEQWGLEVVVEQSGYSPYYTVRDEQRYLLFVLRYSESQ
jgi:hypothetical protein